MTNGKKLTFFKFGKLEVLVNGQLVDTVELSKRGKFLRVTKSEVISRGVYPVNMEEMIGMLSRRVERDYGPQGFFGYFRKGPEIKIRDLTNSREKQY